MISSEVYITNCGCECMCVDSLCVRPILRLPARLPAVSGKPSSRPGASCTPYLDVVSEPICVIFIYFICLLIAFARYIFLFLCTIVLYFVANVPGHQFYCIFYAILFCLALKLNENKARARSITDLNSVEIIIPTVSSPSLYVISYAVNPSEGLKRNNAVEYHEKHPPTPLFNTTFLMQLSIRRSKSC